MRSTKTLILAALACSLAGCQLLPNSGKSNPPAQKTAPTAPESVLYARDGSVVSSQGAGSTQGLPRRDVQGNDGSRAKILELYQRVVEERDKLNLDLAARDAELQVAQKSLATESARATELEARLRTAEQSTTELCNQNLDLAARLTTAQIRGLEAEKRWLELSLSLPDRIVASSVKAEPAARPAPPAEKHPAEQH